MSYIMHFAYRISFEEGAVLLSPWTGAIMIGVNPGYVKPVVLLLGYVFLYFVKVVRTVRSLSV
jgi:hypothetical protein